MVHADNAGGENPLSHLPEPALAMSDLSGTVQIFFQQA